MKSIAVLPFVNMSSDPEQEYFVDGITEDLIDRLAKHTPLRVIARTSSFYFKNRADDVRAIGARLGVTHLVEGSARRVGKKIRVTAQLVRTHDGGHEWSDQYDHELEDVFALQDEITKDVTRQLTDLLVEPITTYQPIPEAYDEYLRGQAWLRRPSYRAAKRARSFFDRAIGADPDYAEAYAAAAEASIRERKLSVDNVLEPLDRAADYVDKALALDDSLASALLQKAHISLARDFDIQGALDLLRGVLDGEPDTYETLNSACTIYPFAGRLDLAVQAARKIRQMDPMSHNGNHELFWLLLSQGRLDEAQEAGEALLAIHPESDIGQASMVDLMARQGRIDEALALIENHSLQDYPQACFVYAAAGRRDEIERVIALNEARSGLKMWLAHGYALLGDIDSALRSLRKAIDNRDPYLRHLTGHGPYHDCVNIDGVKLGAIYDGEDVQALLSPINLDQESIRRLKI